MAKKKMTLEEKLEEAIVKDAPYEVPENWVWAKLNVICDVRDGTHDSPTYVEKGVPLITSKNLKNGEIVFENVNYISNEDHELINKRSKVNIGDILFAMIGTIGNPVLITDMPIDFSIKNVALFKSKNKINDKFIYYYVQSFMYMKYLEKNLKGSTQKFISLGKLRESYVALPPLKEQQRIVNRIESLFEKLDKSKELIEEARDGFERRKEIILKNAFIGKLTINYRNGKNSKDNAHDLVKDIRKQLEQWYKDECSRAKLLGIKKPRKLNFNTEKSEFEYLFKDIPLNWRVSYFQEIIEPIDNALKAGPFGSSLKKSMYVDSGYKIYGQEQVISGNISCGDYYIDEEKFNELKSCEVREGDLLISLVGTIGKTLVIPRQHEKGIINPRLLKISVNKKISIEYIKRYFESPMAKYIMSEKSHGGTMEILNLDIIKRLPIPLPSLEEQKEIVRILDKLLGDESKIEELTKLEEQIELIKKSILAKAFRGELGTNCEEDESALELLKEILSKDL